MNNVKGIISYMQPFFVFLNCLQGAEKVIELISYSSSRTIISTPNLFCKLFTSSWLQVITIQNLSYLVISFDWTHQVYKVLFPFPVWMSLTLRALSTWTQNKYISCNSHP